MVEPSIKVPEPSLEVVELLLQVAEPKSKGSGGLRPNLTPARCNTVLNLLKAIYSRLKNIAVERKRVTVFKSEVANRGNDGTCCFRIKIRTYALQQSSRI